MQRFRIGYLSTMYHTSHIIRALGWMEIDMHCQAHWALFGTGPAMVEAFAAGQLDAGYIGLPPAMIGIGRGLPLVCVAGGHVEGTVMIAPAGRAPAGSPADIGAVLAGFRGTRLGTPAAGSIHDVLARHLCRSTGATDIEIRNYPWADLMPEAIRAGEIAGAFGTPPLAVLAANTFSHQVVIPPGCIWPWNPSYGIVVTRDLLEHRADDVARFLTLHERACNLILQQPSDAARAIAGQVRVVAPEFVERVFTVSPCYCACLPQDYIEATMAFVPALRDTGYLKRSLQESEVFDFEIITRVHPGPDHYRAPLQL